VKFALALMFAVILAGCSLVPGNVATLWTNHAEFTAYTELFNASQNRYKVQIVYKPLPAEAIVAGGPTPDIVVGDRISGVATIKRFSPLDQILGERQISTAQFYRTLLATGRRDGRQFLLPVSFQLPMILYQQATPVPSDNTTTLTLDQMHDRSTAFQKQAKDPMSVSGFSPLWNPDFLFRIVTLSGADFRQTPRGNLAWDEQKLRAGISETRSWIASVDGGSDSEASFREKYLDDPVYTLLESGRILYYYMPSTDYFSIPAERRRAIRFKWLSGGGQIPALENVLYIGVPNRAKNKGAAYAFLEWFFKPENQAKILEASNYEKMKTFGIGDGFSALHLVNERDYPQYYPSLLNRVPATDELSFSQSLPTDWSDLKKNVLLPWLEGEVTAKTPGQKLEERLKAWRLQKPLQ
jgi:ABC-type glycerol-3-phosphate transport system substrate-binding protein